jgi:hypothetical protein
MFELTNEQRKCFALPPVLDTWRKIEVKAGPYDDYVTYAYADGNRITKVIQVSDTPGYEMYHEFGVEQMLSDEMDKIQPKTSKGKPQNFTAPNLVKKTPIGMALSFSRDYIAVHNNTTDQKYYSSHYTLDKINNLLEFSKWVEDWCRNTGEKELSEIDCFSKHTKIHQKFREGDFFRYRIDRGLYGYGRILVDYGKLRKDGIPFWDMFMGKPLCVAVYHVATSDTNVQPQELVHLKMLPSQMIMDNIFYYGECEIIGNIPIDPREDNYTIHYGRSIALRDNRILYQSGKTFAAIDDGELIGGCGFMNNAIGWNLKVKLPILLECIKENSNAPYWDSMPEWCFQTLQNPKYRDALNQIKKQMGVE